MKKIILLLLLANLSPNIWGAGASAKESEEMSEIRKQFSYLLKLEDFELTEAFIIKYIDYINKPDNYDEIMINIVAYNASHKKISGDFAYQIIKLMIHLGANVLHKYSWNSSVFHLTPDLVIKAIEEIEKENKELNEELLTDSQMPQEIIDIVQSYHSEKIPKLMGHPILNSRTGCDRTPLHYMGCFGNNRPEGVKLLIKYKADLEAKDTNGRTPIFYAINGETEILKLFIELGANITFNDYYNKSPLKAAYEINRRDSAQILWDEMKKKKDTMKVEKTSAQCCLIQ